ncbi:hypothetical protein ACA910_010964 [Epithemia clementina (nom. ined.)]
MIQQFVDNQAKDRSRQRRERARRRALDWVRVEDLLFQTPKVIQAIADCAGMDMHPGFRHVLLWKPRHDNCKNNSSAETKRSSGQAPPQQRLIQMCNDMVVNEDWIAKMSKDRQPHHRRLKFWKPYLPYVKSNLNADLMKLFHYTYQETANTTDVSSPT